MRLNSAAISAAIAASVGSSYISAYVHQLPRGYSVSRRMASSGAASVAVDHAAAMKRSTALSMAFRLKEGEKSNMFEGPTPLVKERDACGVGFIANTGGGEL